VDWVASIGSTISRVHQHAIPEWEDHIAYRRKRRGGPVTFDLEE